MKLRGIGLALIVHCLLAGGAQAGPLVNAGTILVLLGERGALQASPTVGTEARPVRSSAATAMKEARLAQVGGAPSSSPTASGSFDGAIITSAANESIEAGTRQTAKSDTDTGSEVAMLAVAGEEEDLGSAQSAEIGAEESLSWSLAVPQPGADETERRADEGAAAAQGDGTSGRILTFVLPEAEAAEEGEAEDQGLGVKDLMAAIIRDPSQRIDEAGGIRRASKRSRDQDREIAEILSREVLARILSLQVNQDLAGFLVARGLTINENLRRLMELLTAESVGFAFAVNASLNARLDQVDLLAQTRYDEEDEKAGVRRSTWRRERTMQEFLIDVFTDARLYIYTVPILVGLFVLIRMFSRSGAR